MKRPKFRPIASATVRTGSRSGAASLRFARAWHSYLGLLAILVTSGCFQSACASGGQPAGSFGGAAREASEVLVGEDEVPHGFVAMEVLGVLPTSEGNAVFLADRQEDTVLPIWIGPAEAMSIQLRLERRRFERPLTHDLLDALVKELGGRVLRVHIVDLKGSTFVATIFVRAEGRIFTVDARPSDAIAIAVGNRTPIFVAIDVVDRAGMGRDSLPDRPEDRSLDESLPEGHPLLERDEPGIIGPPPTQSL